MDSLDVLDALRHLAASLHLDTTVGMLVIASSATGAAFLVRLAFRKRTSSNVTPPDERPTLSTTEKLEGGDTLLVMPDISGYTRFVAAASSTNTAEAKDAIVELLDALMRSVGDQLQVAKLEGDAILFYTDADRIDPNELGEITLHLYRAFDSTKRDLVRRDASTPIRTALSNLDLKIVVHKGHTERFAFRNAVDLIGSDVVLIYRLLKTARGKQRYIIATETGAARLVLPRTYVSRDAIEDVPDFGNLAIKYFDVPPNTDNTVKRKRLSPRSFNRTHSKSRSLVA